MRLITLLLVTLACLLAPLTTIGADAAMMHKGKMSHKPSMTGPVQCRDESIFGNVTWSCQRGQKCCYNFWGDKHYCAPANSPPCNT